MKITSLATDVAGEEHIALSGALTEDFFGPAIPAGTQLLRVNLKQVTRVNSGGVRSWIQWLNSLPAELERRFEECSFAITQQATNISNFLPGRIMGYHVPYFCDACSREAVTLIEAPALPPPTQVCPGCAKDMTLDLPIEMLVNLFESPADPSAKRPSRAESNTDR